MYGAAMFAPLTPDERGAAPGSSVKPSVKVPIIPVPDDAPDLQFRHPKFGLPDRSWPYHDAAARLVGYVCRWDYLNDEGNPSKEVLPITFCDLGNGRRGWRSKGIPSPRPLMALPEILARTDAPVLVVEGEKTRDAVVDLFPELVVTTPAHGAKSPHLTDFAPVAGRTVIIATDHDEPGRTDTNGKPLHPGQDFGDKVCELVRRAGAADVRHLHPTELGFSVWQGREKVDRDGAMPDGWDLADAVDEGWTADRIGDNFMAALPAYRDADERRAEREATGDTDRADDRGEWSFRLARAGVEKRIERTDKETGLVTVEWRWFCSHLEVLAETRSSEGEEWGRLLSIRDRDARTKQWAMPMSMLAGDGASYRERLLSLGLVMAPGKFARDSLHEYISTARPDTKARCVGRVGWHSRSFALSNSTTEPTYG